MGRFFGVGEIFSGPSGPEKIWGEKFGGNGEKKFREKNLGRKLGRNGEKWGEMGRIKTSPSGRFLIHGRFKMYAYWFFLAMY